jgi:Regulated-SNARE-like domain
MDFTYLCLTEMMFPKRTAFAFLDDTKTRFGERYPLEVRNKALPNAMQESFVEELKVRLDTYNKQPENEKMQRL